MHKKNLSSTKVALITGGARRIGAAIARRLHANGLNVVLHYNLSADEALTLCEEFNQQRPHSAVALKANLQESESEKCLAEAANQVWHRLDVLVNNASRFYPTPFAEVTEYAWNDLMTSNLKAPFFLAQAAAPFLMANEGLILNITDIHAERPLRDYSVYCLSKSALTMMTKVLAKELGPTVRVNAIAPGAILWPEGENSLSVVMKQKIIEETLLAREGDVEDIAKAVLFFVNDANYVTGQILCVDGGRSLCR